MSAKQNRLGGTVSIEAKRAELRKAYIALLVDQLDDDVFQDLIDRVVEDSEDEGKGNVFANLADERGLDEDAMNDELSNAVTAIVAALRGI